MRLLGRGGPFTRRAWGRGPREAQRPGLPPTALVVALVLACASLMLLDRGDGGSPVDPARSVVGEVLGPAQRGTAAAVRPFVELPGYVRSKHDLQAELTDLRAENDQLRTEVRRSGLAKHTTKEVRGLVATATGLGYALVPARVIGIGPSQSFSDTVTIDAGSDSGLQPDMTVVSGAGLVGRVLRTTRTTATVLLVVDADSTVGGRVGESMELGFLHGRGSVGGQARLDLELVDPGLVPAKHDTVLTWGSRPGTGPYVPGVPVGEVTHVYSSLRDSSQRVVVDPFVDFSALDLVGVVVPSGTTSDRAVVEADGSIR